MSEIPLWAAIVVGVLLVASAGMTLLGCIGLARFGTFYARIHAPTLGTSFGMVGTVTASALYFSLSQGRPVIHEILIVVFVTVTTPVTLMLLARAALHRDRSDGLSNVPAPRPHTGNGEPSEPL